MEFLAIQHFDTLREWARGSYTDEAATELLIRGFRGRFAELGQPWIKPAGPGTSWIDWDAITPDTVGPLSGGERRYLGITASIGGGLPVNLHDDLHLDRGLLELVLAAMAHAAGSHEQSEPVFDAQGVPTGFHREPSLHPWPATTDD
ncbi:hypothetical protein [Nakamurella lactea]|uniref:hypothetical protein n=1 Tax=Nakamurella lactea TaxID=459515 RepID=UPI000400C656|nr:hypothetical protein [Nakamurella lactea]